MNLSRWHRWVVILPLVLMSFAAHGRDQSAGLELARRLMHTSGGSAAVESVCNAYIDAMMTNPHYKDAFRGNPRYVDVMREWVRRVFTGSEYEEVVAQLYLKHFSEDEMKQLLDFYATPAGRKLLTELPEISREGMHIGTKLASQHSDELKAMLASADEAQANSPEGKIRKATSDLRTLAVCVEAFATDENRYPAAPNIDALAKLIEPTYVKNSPRTDPWGHPYLYVVSPDGQHYRFVSAGPDGDIDLESRSLNSPLRAGTKNVVYQDGEFLTYGEQSSSQ